jgi:hypothetical protein
VQLADDTVLVLLREPVRGTHGVMVALIGAEIGAFAALDAGFADAQF